MKRSEYVKRAGTVTDYCGRLVGGEVGERAARLAEEAGVQWDPEEPGLPEKLGYLYLAPNRMLLMDGEGKPLGVVVIERQRLPLTEVYELLARSLLRYNDYPKLKALTRELYVALDNNHQTVDPGECALARCPTCDLLRRAEETIR